MTEIVILCVEDDRPVLEALAWDLEPFREAFRIELSEDAEEAGEVVESLKREGKSLGIVLCDHRLPGASGVDFLVKLHHDPETRPARKILVTGQAGLEDTIRAVNNADLNHYIEKPWNPDALREVVRNQLTEFVIRHSEDLKPYMKVLDSQRLLEAIRDRGGE